MLSVLRTGLKSGWMWVLLILCIVIYDFAQGWTVDSLFIEGRVEIPTYIENTCKYIINYPWSELYNILGSVTAEDVLFRALPIALSARFFKSGWVIAGVIVASSVLFALIHQIWGGSVELPVLFGISCAGILLSILYLLFGGWKPNIPIAALALMITAHYFADLSIYMGCFYKGFL
jgi:hypothetical protein